MFGFVIGTLCLIGLIKVARGHHRHGWHGGFGHGYGRGYGRARHRRWGLRWVFGRLATTPGQEKVILEAADAMDGHREALWQELEAVKEDLAASLRSEAYDEARIRSAFERQQALLSQLQETFLTESKKVYEALQPDQRRMVADALEYAGRGPGHHMGCGYHRAAFV